MTCAEALAQLSHDPNLVEVQRFVNSLQKEVWKLNEEMEQLRESVKELKDKLADWESRAQELDTLQ